MSKSINNSSMWEVKPLKLSILVPTRELVVQVVEAAKKLTKYMNVTSVGVFGGVNININYMR